MTNSPNDSVQPARRRQAYGSILSEIRAVPKEQFVPITVDVSEAASTVLRVLPGIRALGAQFVESFIAFSIAKFERLETYALALEHSQTIYSTRTESRVSPVALARSAVKTRNILLSDANALIARDLVSPTALKNLKGTNGYKNIASDLRALAQILKSNWVTVSNRSSVALEELDQAEVLADHLETAADEHKKAPETATETVRDRQAAFTLFIKAYEEIRACVEYLRRKQGDAHSIAPSLYLGRSNGKKKPAGSPKVKAPKRRAKSKSAEPEPPNDDGPLTPDGKPKPGGNGPFMP